MEDAIARAAEKLRGARALVVAAGAGMGVDSGLPDFRGNHGFWSAYPLYERLGLSFAECANPSHFERDPAFGWGFYGHRLAMYRSTVPHEGFAILLRWAERFGWPLFAITSNVDGHFQKAGFARDHVLEIHGSIHHLQCMEPCGPGIWSNDEDVPVDLDAMRARHVPRCPRCRGVARPNILMFGDGEWLSQRTDAQESRFDAFLRDHGSDGLAVVELGAGTAIPSIRFRCERMGARLGAAVVRVNPREPDIGPPHVSIAAGAREALVAIDRALGA